MQKVNSFRKLHHWESISCALSSIAISKVIQALFFSSPAVSCPSQGVLKEVTANVYELQEGPLSLQFKTVLYDLIPLPVYYIFFYMILYRSQLMG